MNRIIYNLILIIAFLAIIIVNINIALKLNQLENQIEDYNRTELIHTVGLINRQHK